MWWIRLRLPTTDLALLLADAARARHLGVGRAPRRGDGGAEQVGVGAPERLVLAASLDLDPAPVDQQVAPVEVLDADRHDGVVEHPLEAVRGDAEEAVALGERVGHRVERAAQQRDLAGAALGDPDVEGAVGQLAGRQRDAPDRPQDVAAQVPGERQQEDRRDGQAGAGHPAGVAGARLRVGAAAHGQALLGGVEDAEALAQLVDPGLAALHRVEPVGARHHGAVGAHGGGVGAHVGVDRPAQRGRAADLGRDARERAQLRHLARDAGAGIEVGLQEGLAAGEEVAAQAGLEVDDAPLEAVGDAQDLLRVASAVGGVALRADAVQLHREHARDDHEHDGDGAEDGTREAGAEGGAAARDPCRDGGPHG